MQSIMELVAEPLTSEGFSPFGQVLESSTVGTRLWFNESLENARVNAAVNLSIGKINPLKTFPLLVKKMERHPYSSQTFIPIKASKYLVVVAPSGAANGPDLDNVQVFVANSNQAVTYGRGVWHLGMTALESVAEMAVLMWCDGSSDDEEFVDLESPFKIVLPS